MHHLHPALRALPLDQGKVQIRGPNFCLTVTDHSRPDLADALTHGIDLSGSASEAARNVVDLLVDRHLLISGHAPAESRADMEREVVRADFLNRQLGTLVGRKPASEPAVPDIKVFVHGEGLVHAALLATAQSAGLNVHEGRPEDMTRNSAGVTGDSIMVVCADCEDHRRFLEYNTCFVEQSLTALYVCVTEAGLRVGPIVVPGQTACYECFFTRIRNGMEHVEQFDSLVLHEPSTAVRLGTPRLAAGLAAHLAALELVHLTVGGSALAGLCKVTELMIWPPGLEVGEVLRLPRCRVCGSNRPDQPVQQIRNRRIGR